MGSLLRFLLQRFVRHGTLNVSLASGMRFTCGDGSGAPINVRFTSKALEHRILIDPEMGLGEGYMDGALIVENATIADLVALMSSQPTLFPGLSAPLQYL